MERICQGRVSFAVVKRFGNGIDKLVAQHCDVPNADGRFT